LIWEVPRKEEFAPLKNGLSAEKDNPKTCREAVMQQHAKWLKANGCTFLKKQGAEIEDFSEKPFLEVEISPLVSYDGEVREQYSMDDLNQHL
jgi:UDP-N-acetylglucosamine pyrophosphorylase